MLYTQKEKNKVYEIAKLKRELEQIKKAIVATSQHKKRLVLQMDTIKFKLRGLGVKEAFRL